jgi:hypothetical protein
MKPLIKRSICTALAMLSLVAAPAFAGTAAKATVIENKPPEPWIHALLQLDFSDHYITPRGLNVENEGMVFQPLFLVFWDLYSTKDKSAFLQDVTLTTGVWSSFHTHKSGADPGYWNEFDPIGGLAFKLAGGFKLETNYTAFDSMVDSYPTSSHFEAKLSYDDSALLGAFAIHPYVAFWQELDKKATVTFNPGTSKTSHYFTFGIDPSIDFKSFKIEFPTYINIVGNNFYQKFDGTGGGSGLAVFGTEAKVTVPLTFMPKEAGFWSFYAGVKYYHLNNAGLADGNSVLTPNEHKKDLVQYHAGIAIFF